MLDLLFNKITIGILVIFVAGFLAYIKIQNWSQANNVQREQQVVQDKLRKATLSPPPPTELTSPEEALKYLAPVEDAQ
jgi:hypothetical protein